MLAKWVLRFWRNYINVNKFLLRTFRIWFNQRKVLKHTIVIENFQDSMSSKSNLKVEISYIEEFCEYLIIKVKMRQNQEKWSIRGHILCNQMSHRLNGSKIKTFWIQTYNWLILPGVATRISWQCMQLILFKCVFNFLWFIWKVVYEQL
jgi:hypothetical protein